MSDLSQSTSTEIAKPETPITPIVEETKEKVLPVPQESVQPTTVSVEPTPPTATTPDTPLPPANTPPEPTKPATIEVPQPSITPPPEDKVKYISYEELQKERPAESPLEKPVATSTEEPKSVSPTEIPAPLTGQVQPEPGKNPSNI